MCTISQITTFTFPCSNTLVYSGIQGGALHLALFRGKLSFAKYNVAAITNFNILPLLGCQQVYTGDLQLFLITPVMRDILGLSLWRLPGCHADPLASLLVIPEEA